MGSTLGLLLLCSNIRPVGNTALLLTKQYNFDIGISTEAGKVITFLEKSNGSLPSGI